MTGIKYLRSLLGMTAGEFAEKIGADRTALSRWENGVQKIPKHRMEKLVDMFGCDPDILSSDIEGNYEAELQLAKAGQRYSGNDDILNEIEVLIHEHHISELLSDITVNDYLAYFVDQLRRLQVNNETLPMWHVLFAAAASYLDKGYTYLAIGKTDYAKGRIYRNDPMVEAITNFLKLGLKKTD